MPSQSKILLLGAALCSAAFAPLAHASDDPAPDGTATETSGTTLTGDWGGLRTDLHEKGVDLSVDYTSELATNVSGGTKKAVTETGQVTVGAAIDAEKAFGLKGGSFQASVTWRRGRNLVQSAGLDTLLQTQEVYGRGQTFRLTEFSYSQDLGGGLDIKLGRLPVGNDFSSFSCDFMNGSFCGAPIGNIGGDFWYNWPVSQWAARLRARHGSSYAMIGAYEVNPRNLENTFTIGHFKGATGVLIPFEAGRKVRLGATGLPGLYRAGGWYSTADADDVLLARSRQPATLANEPMLQRSGRYGGFVMLQQQLTGHYEELANGETRTTKGLSAFVTFTQADRNTARVDNQITSGIRYLGFAATRPHDFIQLGAARTHLNARAALHEELTAGSPISQGAEYEIEADYGLQLTPWMNVQPNVQYVFNPGGDKRGHDVVALGVKTAISI
ncbi:carbohydrate porin [Novosphingobium profundi]|uniref:carbohydrate porin n=1 Tax=Novosphingobium profundi TaxID=1774954 RepID=UPI001BDB00A0|nr:carbohydrate porin [Novosphingobium profundi]MBT0667348.1 carbohydrate porin [Novosphingobium profundi]